MSGFAVFFVVLAITAFYIGSTNGMKDIDAENGNEHLGQSRRKGFSLQRTPEYQSNTGDEFLQLIQNIARSPKAEMGSYKENNYISNNKDRRNKYGRYSYWPWQYLYVKPPWLTKFYTPRKRNNPLDIFDNNLDTDNNKPGDYSKVYLVLNSEADITESDVTDLSNMVSSVLSKPGAGKTSRKEHIMKKRRYKGFILNDKRRRMRDSKEIYVSKDSKEHDYKVKRPRGEYGGSGGRTAIPYIRHRGDIFEKE